MIMSRRYPSPKMDSSFRCWWTVCILIVVLHASHCYAQQCNADDKKALLEFKAGFVPRAGYFFENWESGKDCCLWNGVNCTSSGRVQELKIDNPLARQGPSPVAERNPKYKGVVGATLGDLTEIRSLELRMIYFNGPMPKTFDKLTKLEELLMSYNNFSGSLSPSIGGATSLKIMTVDGDTHWWSFPGQVPAPVPSSFCQLKKLQTLRLTSLGITGSIPSCFCGFTQLTSLALAYNNLENQIPSCIGETLGGLESVDLSSNKLTGHIPTTLGRLAKLYSLSLDHNKLSGPIPAEIGNLVHLQALSISDNSLSGSIPATFGRLTKLDYLSLDRNKLSGPIPAEMGNLVNLQVLSLNDNSLSGSIPASFGRLIELSFLELSRNLLTRIPPEMGKLAKVGFVMLSDNKLQGTLPSEIGNCGSQGFGHLFFDISNNRLSGPIPDVFGSGNISVFYAANNLFSGGFPLSLAMVDSVDLSYNLLWDLKQTGTSPPAPTISNLYLANNHFSGPVPKWLTDLMVSEKGLSSLDISVNKFTGTFPVSVLGSLNIYSLNASYNWFTGELPTQSFTSGFGSLDLSHNRISGPITSTFFTSLMSNSTMFTYMDLSFNNLNGPLPANSGDFRDLQYLDLSDNKLTGKVPASVEKMPSLLYLDLSHNKFTGRVPSKRPPPI